MIHMKSKNLVLSLLIFLVCLTIIVIPINGALESNRLVLFSPGEYLEPIHGPGQNYTWVSSGHIYGDINGEFLWYEEGYVASKEGEFPMYQGWINGTLETDDGTVYIFNWGNKSGEPYTYQVLASSNPAECRQDRTKCNNRIFRSKGPLYINGEYLKYFDAFGYATKNFYTVPY